MAGLRLDKAELAFLSACQTHLAPRAHSDEPVSLAGALQLAGFRHVVAAQWQLNSLRARHVATSFYEKLLESSGARAGGPCPDSPRRGTCPLCSGAGASPRTTGSRRGVGGVRAPRTVTKKRVLSRHDQSMSGSSASSRRRAASSSAHSKAQARSAVMVASSSP
ncbi:CHAT domain-containing protein [Streptomyces hirsutus]|uniref:CHAT domain-containing protein n=1 Tax=Streptomyces hirsutus TaxID=35620 RepID=UPI003638B7EF